MKVKAREMNARKAAGCAALQTLARPAAILEFRGAFGLRGIPAL